MTRIKLHSDLGSQYTSNDLREICTEFNIVTIIQYNGCTINRLIYKSFEKGASAINWEHAMDHEAQINLGNDNVKLGLDNIADEIHKYGSLLSIEVNHGCRSFNSMNLAVKELKFVSSTPKLAEIDEFFAKIQGKDPGKLEEMSIPLINETIQDYADAVGRYKDSGFKMAMIHWTHGMLLFQFLSPYVNQRTDRYGANLQNRADEKKKVVIVGGGPVGMAHTIPSHLSLPKISILYSNSSGRDYR